LNFVIKAVALTEVVAETFILINLQIHLVKVEAVYKEMKYS